ncbi:carbohydrate ABC transporter permease [Erysipelothrix inopinata]|uniref:Carbohydrate ABC transporter permease n=1 Tax=Erysipelothrix inopinata TaxID=225084 RepID=A0A7G9RWU1_9FIRM|nr:carbohydrate ABC transporter permease [Erysipelothrix inopinata]QNN60066.1 carbohydrate ABC transporter permease [Erysipelothrix inopinata]
MKRFINIISIIFISLLAIMTVFPFIYMVLAGLMTYQEATSIPPTFWPQVLNFSNYAEVFEKAPFVRYFFNTVFVSLITTAGILITSVLAAFALVKLEFKQKGLVLTIMISLLMIPYESIVFTNYQTIARMGLLNTYYALIIPSLASVFYIYYLQGYLKSIPSSYYKAAKIDGCTDLEFIRKIMIPLAKPALVTVGILSFISGWNSFLWPLLVTNDSKYRLLNNGLAAFTSESGSDVHLQMAAATLTIIPILIVYFVFRKEIIRGVSKNGIKG